MSPLRLLAGLVLLSAVALAGCSSPAPAANQVTIKDFAFSPADLRIKAGDSVHFVNRDSALHSVTATNDSFDHDVPAGGSADIRFDHPGTFPYKCKYHAQMATATITVS
jgi:plastocyanin